MDDRYIITIYQKIPLNENIMIFKRVGVVVNVYINMEDEFNEVTYYDKDRRRVTVESMENPYTFVSDDAYCYGYPIALDDLKELYPCIEDDNELREQYLKDISEVVNIAYYDRDNDSVKILVTNEEIIKETETDELFRDFNITYDSLNETEDVTYSLKDFRKMVNLIKEEKYDILKEEILKLSNTIEKINEIEEDNIEEENSIEETIAITKEKNIEKSLDKLNNLIGLDNIKLEINKLLKYLIFRDKVNDKLNLEKPNLHMFFTGNPGTGKTTVARIVGEILYNMGYIEKNKVAEITPEKLIAGYVGQTAIKTNKFIKENKGGVIFIDEAYILAGKSQNYAGEALTEILKELEKNETVFIFAGYKDEMKDFMEMNPGLTSRIGYYLEYKDYTKEELYQIFEHKINNIGFKINDNLKSIIINHLSDAIDSKNFGNGRYIDKLVNKLILEHAINTEKINEEEELITLTENDWKEELKDSLVFKTKVKKIGF